MLVFRFKEDKELHPELKEYDNVPIRILSRGNNTSIIDFKLNSEKLNILKKLIGSSILLVPNECIEQEF